MTNKPPSKRVELLRDRNSKLSAQVSVQRQEINRLQGTLDDLQDKEEERQETFLCVNRLWEELNGSISFLSFRATGNLSQKDNDADENRDSELLEQANPFLAKLLSSCGLSGDRPAANAAKSLTEDLSDVENALRKRMSTTMEAATRVLEAVEEARGDGSTPKDGGGAAGTPTAASASKESQLAAMNNLLKAENNRLKDQALQDSAKIKELASGLADKEEELLVAQRKYLQLKEGGGGAAAAATNATTAPSPGPGPASQQPSSAPPAAGEDAVNSTAEHAAMVAELENVKRLLERRQVEVEQRDGALTKSEREARELRAKLATERENAARARESAKEQVKYYKAELDGLDGRLREFQRERDHLLDKLHDAKREIDIGRDASRRLRTARDDIDALKNRIADAQAKQAAAESEVDRLRASAYTAPTAEELSKMVSSLQKDMASLKKSRDKHKAASEGAEAARATATEATRLLAESKAQLDTVKSRLQTAIMEARSWAAERKAAVEREEELRLFAEVSQNLLGPNSATTAAAMKKQITQFLDKQAAAVSQRLETVAKAAAASAGPSDRETELLAQVESLEEERAVLTARVESLQKEAETLRAEAAGLREDGEAVLKEVESVSEAYEVAQEENAKLLASIQNRDDENVRLLREAAAATRERSNMVEEKNAAVDAAARAEQEADIARRAVEELDARVNALSIDLEKARKEARQLSSQTDAAVREAAAARAAVDAATRDAEAARNEAKTRASERDAEAEALRKEKTRAERALDDAADLQERLGRAGNSGGGSGGGLSAESAALLKMVNCSVCHARIKDRIITKCNHLFCSHCIDANLNTRHRKCPGCGDRFGANDVKPFYFT